jgi:hypothetical protein
MTAKTLLEIILIVAALVFGIVAIVESRRNWAAWGVIALAVVGLIVVWPA